MDTGAAGSRPAIATCFGGGGAFGIGFDIGVATGLGQGGIDVRRGPMIGTSAGSFTVAALAADTDFEHVAAAWDRFGDVVGSKRFGIRNITLTEDAFGAGGPLARSAHGTRAGVAMRLLTLRRTLLSMDEHRPADVVSASSSPVPLARPHRVDGIRYADGGLRSGTSADLAPPADLLLLVAPFARADQRLQGRIGRRQVRKESRRWAAATGGDVVTVTPTDDMVAAGFKAMAAIRDMAIGRRVHDLAIALGRETAQTLRLTHPAVVERHAAS